MRIERERRRRWRSWGRRGEGGRRRRKMRNKKMKMEEEEEEEETVAAGARQRETNSFEVGDRETETPPERSRLQSNSDDAIACSCIRRHLIALALSCQRHYISRPTDLSLSREREETLSTSRLPLRRWTEPKRTFRPREEDTLVPLARNVRFTWWIEI